MRIYLTGSEYTRLQRHIGELNKLMQLARERSEGEKSEQQTKGMPIPTRRGEKLIDLVWIIIQSFAIGADFTTIDIRRELESRYPIKFASINPASVSATVARLCSGNETVIKVGKYLDGIHYQRIAL